MFRMTQALYLICLGKLLSYLLKLSVAKPLIQQVAHYGIADEDALGGEAQVVVGGVHELASMYIRSGAA